MRSQYAARLVPRGVLDRITFGEAFKIVAACMHTADGSESATTCMVTIVMTCYLGGGARYMKHVDTMPSSNRVLTAICYLKEPAHGGQLRLHLPTGACDVEPLMGRLLRVTTSVATDQC